jgi:hypothetical protein
MNRRERPAGLGQTPAGQAERRRGRADQGHSAHCVVIRVAVQEPSPDGFPGAGWTEPRPELHKRTRTHSMDTEHQPTDLAVGSSARFLHALLSS